MYDLERAKDDFPWTRMGDQEAIAWGVVDMPPEDGTPIGWFDDLLPGWGDIIHDGLAKIDALITDDNCDIRLDIEQVKEKWGMLRFYVSLHDKDGEGVHNNEWARRIMAVIREMEDATGKVCCFCGRTDAVRWRRGWVHVSCDECEDGHVRR